MPGCTAPFLSSRSENPSPGPASKGSRVLAGWDPLRPAKCESDVVSRFRRNNLWLRLSAVTLDPAVQAPTKKPTRVPGPRVAAGRTPGPPRPLWTALNAIAAAILSAVVLYAAFFGAGPLPALGPAFNPATGAWTMAADATINSQTLRLAGLQQPAKVTLESDGTSHIVAQTDHDLFLATGYVHARFRLFQMDLLRRQGEGRLSEVIGKAALESDRFELQLGLLRTAELEWNALAPDHRARKALIAYSQGVNDRIAQVEADHQLPV